MFCPECGGQVEISQPFCGFCGAKLRPKRKRKVFVLSGLGIILAIVMLHDFSPSPEPSGVTEHIVIPQQSEAANTQQSKQDPTPQSVANGPSVEGSPSPAPDDQLHLLPNLFGNGAVSDGRTYSIALIADDQKKIPPLTKLFFQGVINGQLGPGAVTITDEQDREKMLICYVSPEENQEAISRFWAGTPVQVYGEYVTRPALFPASAIPYRSSEIANLLTRPTMLCALGKAHGTRTFAHGEKMKPRPKLWLLHLCEGRVYEWRQARSHAHYRDSAKCPRGWYEVTEKQKERLRVMQA
jgi:hypothetical protein